MIQMFTSTSRLRMSIKYFLLIAAGDLSKQNLLTVEGVGTYCIVRIMMMLEIDLRVTCFTQCTTDLEMFIVNICIFRLCSSPHQACFS